MREFVIGDIHGQYKKLKEVLRLAEVDFEKDRVIQLGDIVDRGPDPFGCIDLLKEIKKVVFIRGNHDEEFAEVFLEGGLHFEGHHGAKDTSAAWYKMTEYEQEPYRQFFTNGTQKDYFIDEHNRLFIHAGFNRHEPIANQNKNVFYWDRDFFASSLSYSQMGQGGFDKNKFKFKVKDGFKEVYLGHTPTIYWGKTEPMFGGGGNIINVDTGSGKGGKLTIMDINTKAYWQS